MKKTCIVIAGPTAVGKTSFAIRLAQHLGTSIISADSRQCFKELNIGVARPSPEELQLIPHYFIASHSIHEEVNAVVFEQYALQKIAAIFDQHDTAVMIGGTGLYIKAFCDGIDELPPVNEKIRQQIIDNYQQYGLTWLQNETAKTDPVYFAQGEIKNPQRLMRALEVKISSGRSIVSFQKQQKKERDFNIIKIGLELPREQLVLRINQRVDALLQQGLLDEVKALQPFKNLNALQTVGYRELFDHFDGLGSLESAIEKIKINTRQYAKRQMTWFKKDPEIHWVTPEFHLSALQADFLSGK